MIANCLILDDEPLALDLLEDYVNQTPFLHLSARCSSPIEALETIKTQKVDIAFLDIQMPMLNGLDFSKMLSDCSIIFTTAFKQYAIDGYKVNAIGYLLKPFSYNEFLEAANKGYKLAETKKKAEIKNIIVRVNYRQQIINLDSIDYIESVRDYMKFHLDTGETVLTQMSLKSLEESLPKNDFVRVHRSYIVNIKKIKIIERSRIVMGDVRIPISDGYRSDFDSRFIGYKSDI